MARSNGDVESSTGHRASPQPGGADRRVNASEVQAVRKLFTEAQRTVQCHRRCCDALRRLLSKHKTAWDEYLACVSRILVVFKRDPGVERLVQFVVLLATSGVGVDEEAGRPRGGALDDEHGAALLDRTVEFLLARSAAADKAVRFRCCQLLGGMTTEYTQRPLMSEEEHDRVVDMLLPRLQDKVAGVRVQAVAALRPFQFELEEDEDHDEVALGEDRVRAELMRAMKSDSSPDVREAALVAVTKAVGMFDQLVLRTQDVKESVRKAAFRTLGGDVSSKLLHPQQRVELVKMGMSDASEAVVEACRFMVCVHWFRDVGYDPVELLKRLDVLKNEKEPEQVIKEIVRLGLRADRERGDPSLGIGLTMEDAKALRMAAGRRVSLGSLGSGGEEGGSPGGGGDEGAGRNRRFSPEEALFVRVQAEVVKEDKELCAVEKETRLEAILPDTTFLCGQIEMKAEELKQLQRDSEAAGEGAEDDPLDLRLAGEIFVLQQLLKLAAYADPSDEAGRRRLVNLLQALLVDANMTHLLVESSMEALAAAHPFEADFVRVVAELVNDMSDLVHSQSGGGEASVHNASVGGSINTSFASVLGALGDAVAATPSRSLSIMRSAVRAAIPKNFVKDRARAIEGIPAMEGVLDEGSNGGGGAKGKGKAAVPVESISSEDEFLDAVSHHSNDNSGVEGEGEGDSAGVRQVAGGVGVGEDGGLDVLNADLDMRRMFRILDMLSVLLTKTRQTLAKDATLTAFEDVIMETLSWSTDVLPKLSPNLVTYDLELREQAVQALGKYSLLGEAAAMRHRPTLLTIALCEEEAVNIRVCAMQALSDLSLIFRGAVFGSTGDLLSMFAGILKDRTAHRGMVAVAAEAVSRLLFFGLAREPELLARLFVLYFEKGSAADPTFDRSGEEGGDEEEEVADIDRDAKAIGSSVRLSQILGVYFRSLPVAPTRVRDMLFESMRHALHVLREIAELNVAAKKNNEDEENEEMELIEVPAQAVVKFVLELMMMHEEGATSPSAKKGPSTSSSPPLPSTASSASPSSPSAEGTDASEEGGDEHDGKPNSDLESNGQEKSTSDEQNGADKEEAATQATAHAALCLTEELWSLSGIDGLSDLMLALAKVLASLPLPQDDQGAVKRLRNGVYRLEALGDGRLGAKVSRIIAKYSEVLLAADLTPKEGITKADDSDSDEDEDSNDDSRDSVAGKTDASVKEVAVEAGERAKGIPSRKKSTRARASPPTSQPEPSRRPVRKSKVAAKMKMADAEAAAAAAAAIDTASSSSESSDDEEADSDGATAVEKGTEDSSGDDEVSKCSESDDSPEDTPKTVEKATPARGKKGTPRRSPRRRSSRVTPLSEISNSPVPS